MSDVTLEMLKKNPVAALEQRRREIVEEMQSLVDALRTIDLQLRVEQQHTRKDQESAAVQMRPSLHS